VIETFTVRFVTLLILLPPCNSNPKQYTLDYNK
jgi:hypothetical protein